MGFMETKFCEACDEDYDWAAPECPGCVRRRHDESRVERIKELVIERDEFRARWEVEVREAEEAMRERDALRAEVERLHQRIEHIGQSHNIASRLVLNERQAEVRAWAASRIAHCEAVMLKYAEPRPDIPLEPVERRGELRALKAVLAMLDGKETP